jgi:predicted RNA-binding Zn ribbon-like protein
MATGPETPAQRRPPGFFLGDHPALDFLNTQASPGGVPTEWLGNGADLLSWLQQAALIEADVVGRFRPSAPLDHVAKGARALREWLRAFVDRHAGQPLTAAAEAELGPLNLLLAGDNSFGRVAGGAEGLATQRLRRWEGPEELLQPIASAIADLVCHADFRLIRACEGHDCTLMFLDRTKAHARRWCSMALCGNRAKAAAHRARLRR